MTAKGTVIEITDDTHAIVKTVRKSACADCHKKSDTGCRACDVFLAKDTMDVKVINTVGAGVGDEVILESASSYVIFAAAMVFLVPLIAAILLFCLFEFALSLKDYAPLAALSGFLLGIAAAVIYGRAEKNKERIKIAEIINKSTQDK